MLVKSFTKGYEFSFYHHDRKLSLLGVFHFGCVIYFWILQQKIWAHSNIATTMYLHSFISLTPQFVLESIAQQLGNLDCQNPTLAIVTNRPSNNLLHAFTNAMIIDHTFLWLPMSPYMLWCFHKMSRSWFNVVG